MKWFLITFFGCLITFFGALLVESIVTDLRGRGEVAEAPAVEEVRPRMHRPVRVYRRVVPSLSPYELQALIDCEREMQDVPSFERLADLYLVPTEDR